MVKGISDHLLIKNCSMENLTGSYTLRDRDHISAFGISIEGAENVRIENCSVPGIAFKGVKNGYLANSVSSDDIIVEETRGGQLPDRGLSGQERAAHPGYGQLQSRELSG